MLEKLAGNLPRLSILIKYFLGWFILFCDLLIKLFFVMGWSQNMDCYEIWIMFYISPITQIRRINKNENFEIYLVLIQSLNKMRQFIARIHIQVIMLQAKICNYFYIVTICMYYSNFIST